MSHIPRMANAPDAPGSAVHDEVVAAFRAAGDALRATQPDALIVVAPDHFQNFFIDNMPAIAIGYGESHRGPAEPWIRNAPQAIPGAAHLAEHLITSAYRAGFDPAFSHNFRLDHGYVLPLRTAGFDLRLPIVPIVLNSVQPPFPTAHRMLAFGRMLATAIAASGSGERVLLIVSGGLSHSIAEPGMGRIDEPFDRSFLARLEADECEALADRPAGAFFL